MYAFHEEFTPPSLTATLWRYMSLKKLADILKTRELFFAPAAAMSDEFEGAYPESNSLFELPHLNAEDRARAKQNFDATRPHFRQFRHAIFLSCWHSHESETEGMWSRYSEGGIAIKTSFWRLSWAISHVAHPIFIGMVKYIDFEAQAIPSSNGYAVFTPYLFKRLEFFHEAEVRMVTFDAGSAPTLINGQYIHLKEDIAPPPFVRVPVDPAVLIDRVIVAPNTSAEYENQIRELLGTAGMANRLQRSKLELKPKW
jgi:hypothetical protein